MPKTKRDTMKRWLAQAVNHNVSGQKLIGRLFGLFENVHPDYAELLVLIGQSMSITEQLMRQFWVLAWGPLPDDLKKYMS